MFPDCSGLLGGHVMASELKRRGRCCGWYKDELLAQATDIGNRLLPAFNTTTGIPYPRVSLSKFMLLRIDNHGDIYYKMSPIQFCYSTKLVVPSWNG